MARKIKGRQKVEMVKMTNGRTLQATFSKRRSGLFKKASELCTLCNVEVTIIVFSPGNKVFSFGYPCVESVVEHFLIGIPPLYFGSLQAIQGHSNPNICELNLQLTQVLDELEVEKKRGDELIEIGKASQSPYWWETPIDELDSCLKALKNKVILQAQKVLFQSSAPCQYPGESFSSGGIIQAHPNNNSNDNMVPPPLPPPMIQSSAPSQYLVGNSSTEGIIPIDPMDYNFKPSNINMMPPPPLPSPHQH